MRRPADGGAEKRRIERWSMKATTERRAAAGCASMAELRPPFLHQPSSFLSTCEAVGILLTVDRDLKALFVRQLPGLTARFSPVYDHKDRHDSESKDDAHGLRHEENDTC